MGAEVPEVGGHRLWSVGSTALDVKFFEAWAFALTMPAEAYKELEAGECVSFLVPPLTRPILVDDTSHVGWHKAGCQL